MIDEFSAGGCSLRRAESIPLEPERGNSRGGNGITNRDAFHEAVPSGAAFFVGITARQEVAE